MKVRPTMKLETRTETPILPKSSFLSDDCSCNSGFLNHITDTIMPHKTIIRLSGVARNPANGFPARLLAGPLQLKLPLAALPSHDRRETDPTGTSIWRME